MDSYRVEAGLPLVGGRLNGQISADRDDGACPGCALPLLTVALAHESHADGGSDGFWGFVQATTGTEAPRPLTADTWAASPNEHRLGTIPSTGRANVLHAETVKVSTPPKASATQTKRGLSLCLEGVSQTLNLLSRLCIAAP